MLTAGAEAPRYRRSRPSRDGFPDTTAAFARLACLDPGPERDRLREQVVEAWLPVAHRIARRFRDKGESLEDLRQVAAMGLLRAVDRYEADRGAFASYAVPTITGELRRHFRDHMWDLHVPRSVQELRNRVRAAHRELAQRPGSPEPGVSDIAAHSGLTEGQVREGMRAIHSYRAFSLDAALLSCGSEGLSLVDGLGAMDSSYDLVTDREAAKSSLRLLPERERTILYLRFFENMSQTRIAEHLGISQMHVSRLIRQSCDRVRAQVREATDPHVFA
ncbi:SigB/SigF/SigG family RNA polymerase sigma factor [Streptomyces longisporoflavus]|uniref:SigB/SigF/SigG family RNA polymerase sigma factor n=1 Tax=Streptomyces longisporoflavus TaxID=28044 RepID=A0ABW7QQL4_9ACTN